MRARGPPGPMLRVFAASVSVFGVFEFSRARLPPGDYTAGVGLFWKKCRCGRFVFLLCLLFGPSFVYSYELSVRTACLPRMWHSTAFPSRRRAVRTLLLQRCCIRFCT